MNFLPILNFHGLEREKVQEPVSLVPGSVYALPISVFSQALREMKQAGFSCLDLKGLKGWVNNAACHDKKEKSSHPESRRTKGLRDSSLASLSENDRKERMPQNDETPNVMLTFDDGLLSQLEAVPLLKSFGYSAVFFVSAGWVGQPGYMSWNQLKELTRDGHTIASHGLNHLALTDLEDEKLEEEITGSKKILEDQLGVPVKAFSVPRGYLNERVHDRLKKSGYEFIFTSRFDLNVRGQDFFSLNRLAPKSKTSASEILDWLSGDLGMKKYFEKCKDMGRRWMSPAHYDSLAALKRKVS